MSHSSRLGADRVSRTLASNRLGVPAVVFFVLSAATPLTVVAGVVTTGFAVTGIIGLPIAFAAIAALLALFSVGYVAMSRHVTNAGAFYTYVTHGLGRPAGVAAAYMALLAYNLLQVGLYGIIGVAAAPQLDEWFGITLDWWVIALIAWAIVGILGVLRIDVNGTVLAVLLLAEMAIILIYAFASLLNPADGDVTFDALQVGNLFESGAGAILVLAVLGFVGFEASVVYSEESRDPKRTIALATYISIVVVAAVYVLASWAMTVAAGPDNIVPFAQEFQNGVIFIQAEEFLGTTWVDIGETLFITSVFAAMISFHNTVARYVFALGRERVLPGALGRTSPSSGAPVAASIVQSAIGLIVILVYAFFDLDPLVQLFFNLGTTGGFGVLSLVALTSVAVLAFFWRHPSGENAWRRVIAPGLATILLLIVVILAISNYDILIGVATDAPERWILPGLFVIAALIGVVWARFLKSSRPDVYEAIGRGANAATGISVLDLSAQEEDEPGQPSLR
ncbi:amino acid transporter [Jiangella mangrovi]|uniref:Amino acid transporter n=1 Tax=Jiangella mangrovi TaxID=1524084 RepID=A0A7W9GKI7_9ACTN|nr:amino acid transporter [Jiangella mangrovi]